MTGEFEAHKAEALSFHIDPPDVLETQLAYIAGDKRLFPDDALDANLQKLHPQMDEVGISGLAKRVRSIRYPEPTQDPNKP